MTRQTPDSSYDAIVVGARCAGAATAMLLARQGLKVLNIDRGRQGADTLSTHALMRGGVLQLHRWGVLPALAAAGTPPVRSTSFHYGDETIDIAIKPRDGIEGLFAPLRTVIDSLLVDAAVEAGVDVIHGTRLVDLVRAEDGTVTGAVLDGPGGESSVSAGIVIGADGRRSSVARLAGSEAYRVGKHAGGVVYGYFHGLPANGFHWYYRPGVGAGAIPTNRGLTCVFASVAATRFRDETRTDAELGFRRMLHAACPELAESVADALQVGKLRAFAGEVGFLRQSHGPGWALVGDAGYFKDPFTAHGMTDALRDAELLARAVASGTPDALAGYQETRDELSTELFDITDALASYEWDLEEAQQLHLKLSKEMNREVETLTALDSPLRRTA
jgi:flavin-dependent dehydrogenase